MNRKWYFILLLSFHVWWICAFQFKVMKTNEQTKSDTQNVWGNKHKTDLVFISWCYISYSWCMSCNISYFTSKVACTPKRLHWQMFLIVSNESTALFKKANVWCVLIWIMFTFRWNAQLADVTSHSAIQSHWRRGGTNKSITTRVSSQSKRTAWRLNALVCTPP